MILAGPDTHCGGCCMMRSYLVTLVVGMSLGSGTGRADEALIVHVNDVDKSGSLVFPGSVINSALGNYFYQEKPIKVSLNDVKVYNRFGKMLASEEVMDRVKPGTVLVIGRMGDKFDRSKYLFLTRETLILILIKSPTNERHLINPAESSFAFLVRTIIAHDNLLRRRIAELFVGE
jgi:hypothetical protein